MRIPEAATFTSASSTSPRSEPLTVTLAAPSTGTATRRILRSEAASAWTVKPRPFLASKVKVPCAGTPSSWTTAAPLHTPRVKLALASTAGTALPATAKGSVLASTSILGTSPATIHTCALASIGVAEGTSRATRGSIPCTTSPTLAVSGLPRASVPSSEAQPPVSTLSLLLMASSGQLAVGLDHGGDGRAQRERGVAGQERGDGRRGGVRDLDPAADVRAGELDGGVHVEIAEPAVEAPVHLDAGARTGPSGCAGVGVPPSSP